MYLRISVIDNVYYNDPRILISRALNGMYKIEASTNATSNPISPVILAMGPVYHACAMDGTTKPNDAIPAPTDATPDGNNRALSQLRTLYCSKSFRLKMKCSIKMIPM